MTVVRVVPYLFRLLEFQKKFSDDIAMPLRILVIKRIDVLYTKRFNR
jgi:hypothetical protein